MSDRELLEMAARAAGYDTSHKVNAQRLLMDPPVMSLWITEEGELKHTAWNPITNDSDAFRLAVILDLDIQWLPKQRFVSAGRLGIGENIAWDDESERSGALRRAITVAAAKIGKSL